MIAILSAIALFCALAPALQKQESAPALPTPTPVTPGPLYIDAGRQLFVDNYLIQRTDLKRIFHQARLHESNPVLKPEMAV